MKNDRLNGQISSNAVHSLHIVDSYRPVSPLLPPKTKRGKATRRIIINITSQGELLKIRTAPQSIAVE